MKIESTVTLWDAINEYAVACRGKPDQFAYGNVPRMDAVARVDRIVVEECEQERTAERERILAIVREVREGYVARGEVVAVACVAACDEIIRRVTEGDG